MLPIIQSLFVSWHVLMKVDEVDEDIAVEEILECALKLKWLLGTRQQLMEDYRLVTPTAKDILSLGREASCAQARTSVHGPCKTRQLQTLRRVSQADLLLAYDRLQADNAAVRASLESEGISTAKTGEEIFDVSTEDSSPILV